MSGALLDLSQPAMCPGCTSRPAGAHGHEALREAMKALSRGRRYQPLVRIVCPACGTRWVRLRSPDRTYRWLPFA